jgi:hypothetical protein
LWLFCFFAIIFVLLFIYSSASIWQPGWHDVAVLVPVALRPALSGGLLFAIFLCTTLYVGFFFYINPKFRVTSTASALPETPSFFRASGGKYSFLNLVTSCQ